MFQPCLKMLLLLLMPVCSIAQLVVTNLKENILYIGVDNYIDYAVTAKQAEKITLMVSRGELITSNNKLIYRHCANKPGLVTFYALDKASKKVIDSVLFRLKPLPDPTIELIAIDSNEGVYLGKNIVRDMTGVLSYLSSDYETPMKIIEYEVIIAKPTGQRLVLSNKGSRLMQEVRDEFLKLEDNDVVTIRNFEVHFACETPDRLVKQVFVYRILRGEAKMVEEKP